MPTALAPSGHTLIDRLIHSDASAADLLSLPALTEEDLAYAAEQFVMISHYTDAEKLIENGACGVLAIALAGRYAPEVCSRLVAAELRSFKSVFQKDPAAWWRTREDMIAKMRACGRDEATMAWELRNFGYSLDVAVGEVPPLFGRALRAIDEFPSSKGKSKGPGHGG